MTAFEQVLINKIRQLPPERVAEVEDFVDFLCAREADRHFVRAGAMVAETSFAAAWENDEDAAYDRMQRMAYNFGDTLHFTLQITHWRIGSALTPVSPGS